ncbi:YeeE/YedE family protein [Inmirania thermothiophila]|uniref:Uncharacterized protein n=1 Tax=Inmirania thermothiophila TaxID=1750597 RepID=A0A3N1XT30_9GAMM|nr:YeeE/YedE family protein [Inmirania thermothiophila]ROR29790.1 hypothetical protein EDC57_2468 [Inmirania thermothiophila]
MELEITQKVLGAVFVLSLVLGAVANKTNFCTMGAVSDLVNMGHTGRIRAWLFAIAVATAGTLALEAAGILDLSGTRPPYRSALFMWPRFLLGGLLFGIGMTLASGCGNKTLVRIGGGNLKSLVVFLVMGLFAFLMTRTDFYGVVFHSWMLPLSIDLAALGIPSQELGTLLGAGGPWSGALHYALGAALVAGLVWFAFRSEHFRTADNIVGGLVVGAVVVGAWYVTGGPWGADWKEFADFAEQPPAGVGVQSFTFVNPSGETLYLAMQGFPPGLVTFGVVSVAGVILGSLLWALASGGFRVEWFRDLRDALAHVAGGALMGIGGVLGLGCTIGQGVTGVSTLALGSFLALGAIILGAALTMKVQYYRMVYEGEATWGAALLTALADLRLLPARMRRLEAV